MKCVLRAVWAGLLFLAFPGFSPDCRAMDKDVASVVRGIEKHFHVKQARIPLWGTINVAARVARPWKGLGISMAVFEDCNFQSADLDTFEARLPALLSEGWQPFVRIRSRRDHEHTIVLAKPDGNKFELLVVNLEASEASVVKLHASRDDFNHWLDSNSGKKKTSRLED